MSRVTTIGVRLFLDQSRTDAEFLGVRVGMFADLRTGQRVVVDPSGYAVDGPRRGAGAPWRASTVNVDDLPSLDQEFYAVDPLAAATEALEVDFVLGTDQLEQFIRNESSDLPCSSLVAALAAVDAALPGEDLRTIPLQVEFDDVLVAELGA